jgi:hypothetical protein
MSGGHRPPDAPARLHTLAASPPRAVSPERALIAVAGILISGHVLAYQLGANELSAPFAEVLLVSAGMIAFLEAGRVRAGGYLRIALLAAFVAEGVLVFLPALRLNDGLPLHVLSLTLTLVVACVLLWTSSPLRAGSANSARRWAPR